jgi:hypothetical protein
MMESPMAPSIRIIENEMALINCIIVISSIDAEILEHLMGWLSDFSIVESKNKKTALLFYSSSDIEPRATF